MVVWLTWASNSLRQGGWAPIVVFSVHIAAILGWDIYNRIPDFDVPMHFAGGVAIAYFFSVCYRVAVKLGLLGQPSVVVYPPMILGLTSLAAVAWEFAEFVADHQFGLRTQPSLSDTLLDILMGLLGGVAWIVGTRFRPA